MLGTELTQLVAALAFVLTPRMTTLIGVVSVEVWPMALAPWVLLPLVTGSREGSVRRAAARQRPRRRPAAAASTRSPSRPCSRSA